MVTSFKDKRQYKNNLLFKELGVFFAFNQKQFTECAKNETKYTKIGYGGYCPSENVPALNKGLEDIQLEFEKDIEPYRKEYILYELENHEAFYTGDISDTLLSLPESYTRGEVEDVYNENYSNQNL